MAFIRKVRVLELFAGVGGFRVGLDRANAALLKAETPASFDVVWSNQWEPGERGQYASMVYRHHYGCEHHSNTDIAKVKTDDIPDAEMVVGGFPCQDYSVARTLNQASGIVGKKGVLWWEIHRIVEAKRPSLILLENVDRLLKSPAPRRGRDFAIILSTLMALDYATEWRVINAADYGYPQRRRRVFIIAYRADTPTYRQIEDCSPAEWITRRGSFGSAFPCDLADEPVRLFPSVSVDLDPVKVSDTFGSPGGASPFQTAGLAIRGRVHTYKVHTVFRGHRATLGDVLTADEEHWKAFRIPNRDVSSWQYLKGAKSVERTSRAGVPYTYDEGPIPFPDLIDSPSRTIVTGEGGRSPSRFKHVVECRAGYRRLTPVELERLTGFPDDFTRVAGVSDSRRAFFMGNALVTGIVERMAIALADLIADNESLRDHVAHPRERELVH